VATVIADAARPALTKATGYAGDHGFRFEVAGLADADPAAALYAYAVDSTDGREQLLPGSGAVTISAPGEQIPIGYLNSVSAGGVAYGWALDPDAAAEPVAVHFYATATDRPKPQVYLGQVVADEPRPDVNQVTGYPGDHGFAFRLPERFFDGTPRLLQVFGIDPQNQRNPRLRGSGLEFRLTSGAAPADEPAAPPSAGPVGKLLLVNPRGTATGWALDPASPEEQILVHFYVDGPSSGGEGQGVFAGRTLANRGNPPVEGYEDMPHGFRFPLPTELRDGAPHTLYAYGIDPAGKKNLELPGSGLTFRVTDPTVEP
jgi:hypothetical protein